MCGGGRCVLGPRDGPDRWVATLCSRVVEGRGDLKGSSMRWVFWDLLMDQIGGQRKPPANIWAMLLALQGQQALCPDVCAAALSKAPSSTSNLSSTLTTKRTHTKLKSPHPMPPAGVQNRMGGTFFALAFFGFASLTTVDLMMNERAVVMREVRGGYYNPVLYVLSKLTLDGGEADGGRVGGCVRIVRMLRCGMASSCSQIDAACKFC